MLSNSGSLCAAACALMVGLASAPASNAATQDIWFLNAPGDSCQLSLPTIDTLVRPRASGYRNEGTASKFVICGYGSSRWQNTLVANIQASSIDGATHSMNCTFAAGQSSGYVTYVSKTLPVPAAGVAFISISASDFGGTSGNTFDNYELSVTCNLPPNVAIVHLESKQRVDVGN